MPYLYVTVELVVGDNSNQGTIVLEHKNGIVCADALVPTQKGRCRCRREPHIYLNIADKYSPITPNIIRTPNPTPRSTNRSLVGTT